jgi:hypothetical protein
VIPALASPYAIHWLLSEAAIVVGLVFHPDSPDIVLFCEKAGKLLRFVGCAAIAWESAVVVPRTLLYPHILATAFATTTFIGSTWLTGLLKHPALTCGIAVAPEVCIASTDACRVVISVLYVLSNATTWL